MIREIIPIILARDFIDFKTKLGIINTLKPAPKMIQIDISDGKFTPYKNFNNPQKIKNLKIPNFEMHLMVADPIKHAKTWIKAGAKRILFHVGPLTSTKIQQTINFIKSQNIEVGLCLNLETPISVLKPFLTHNPSSPPLTLRGGRRGAIDCVLILCVTPGRSGQKFQAKNLAKIRALRKKYPALPIEADGGVNLDNAKKIFQAGATRLSAASAILNAKNPQQVYTDFLNLAK